MAYSSLPTKKRSLTPVILSILGIIVLVVAGLLIHHFVGKKATSGPIKTISTNASGTPTTKPTPVPAGSQKTPYPSSQPAASSGTTNTTGNSAGPAAPYGSFVSNHKPGQNGSNTTEQSECVTTVGATCYIKFTQGSITKTLASQTTDASGAVFWTWDIVQNGLTSGNWQIEAVASLNGQTQTTKDPLPLEVQ